MPSPPCLQSVASAHEELIKQPDLCGLMRPASMRRVRPQVAEVVRSIGYECVLEEPACGGLAMIDISIRTPDGRKIALEVC